MDNLRSSTEKYNSLVDEYNNKELTASELNDAHTAAVLNLKKAITTAAQAPTAENQLAVSEARNKVIRSQEAITTGAARAAALPGLINEQATTATEADRKAQLASAVEAGINAASARNKISSAILEQMPVWGQIYKTPMIGPMIEGWAGGKYLEAAKDNPHPEINAGQYPMIGNQIGANLTPSSIIIQTLNVGGIGETPIGDTGLMMKIERKRAG
jgi:hypothetical protein